MPDESRSDNNDNSGSGNPETKTWSGAARDKYNDLYESWVPWAEDLYLRYCTRHNKASYATEDALAKTKVTGIQQVDTLQDGVHGLVAGQVGQGGLAQPVGDWLSREGVNRAERQGKDERGGYAPAGMPAGVASAASGAASGAQSAGQAATQGGKSAAAAVGGGVGSVGSGIASGAKSVGGAVGGLFGGGGGNKQ